MLEIVSKIAEEYEIPKAKADRIIKSFFEIVKDEVNTEGSIQLSGFGSFKKVERQARTGRNPSTGKAIKIPKKNAVKFTPAKAFKECLARSPLPL